MRAATVAALVACALLGGSAAAAAVSDSPPTTPTSTGPVSTVTLLPPPPTVPAPKPDAAPVPVHVHKAAVRPVAHASARHPSQPAPASVGTPKISTPPVAAKKRERVRRAHASLRHVPRKTIAKHVRPAVYVAPKPMPVPAARPAAGSNGAVKPVATAGHQGLAWKTPAAGAAFVLLLLAAGLVAGTKKARWVPPAAAVIAGRQAEPPLSPPVATSCRITWWRDDQRSQFFACTWNPSGRYRTLIAESREFSWISSKSAERPDVAWRSTEPPPEIPAAVAAYHELVHTLGNIGWEPDDRGNAWFATHFRRTDRDMQAAWS